MPDEDKNLLYYGDNLEVLRRHVKDESVDLVYLDPPFKSSQDYNVLFAEHGTRSAAQIKAFEDTWRWDEAAARDYEETVEHGGQVAQAMLAFRTLLGTSDMLAYLSMMAPRLVELRRALRETGSLYLHCDPAASHYLKLLLDAIFGPTHFRSEIIWKRSSAHSDARQGRRQHGRIHDSLLFYTKSDEWTWNQLHTQHDALYVASKYPYEEDGTGRRYGLWDMTGPGGAAKGNPSYEVMGVTRYWRYSRARMDELISEGRVVQPRPGAVPRQKRYLDDSPGVPLQDVWDDIFPINSQAKERLGYPTQKPEALLERVIRASSNEGDTVLDPFCGCGTTIAVAQGLGRRWVGIDITHLAINLIKHRLQDAYGEKVAATYNVIGEPTTLDDAEELAHEDPYQFQWWALGLVGARPTEQKKGADKGIDGRVFFHDESGGKTKQIVLSVKAGKTGRAHVHELRGVLEREGADLAALLTFQEPTQPMREEAASAGFYKSPGWHESYPRIQLLTVGELLEGKTLAYPHATGATFKKAPKAEADSGEEALQLDV
jgi:DNA modification methylase